MLTTCNLTHVMVSIKTINYSLCTLHCYWFIVELLSKQRRPADDTRVLHIPKDCQTFKDTYNQIQHQLRALGGMDELLCGKLCKFLIVQDVLNGASLKWILPSPSLNLLYEMYVIIASILCTWAHAWETTVW